MKSRDANHGFHLTVAYATGKGPPNRLVYQVLEDIKTVKAIRMWTHYKEMSRTLKLAFIFYLATTLGSCISIPLLQPASAQKSAGQIANPASENCVKKGGRLVIHKRVDGGEYGVCVFEDNRQCEEWAMFRGECPVSGIKITGYATPAAQYCAITGGDYRITGNSGNDREQGTCAFAKGPLCDAWDYFTGKCNPRAGAGQSPYGGE